MDIDNKVLEAASNESSVNTRRFVSAQRRYDNVRVRDSEISKRLCYDCGEIVLGGEREYQEHILVHEAVYLAYQLYHFENCQQQFSGNQQSYLNEKNESQKDFQKEKSPKERHVLKHDVGDVSSTSRVNSDTNRYDA